MRFIRYIIRVRAICCWFKYCSKKLDETTAELKKMAIELENEKAKTDRLLHEMLPKKVADQLKQGKTVEAGMLTILSDLLRSAKASFSVERFILKS
mgnify:CR=1 FL=1